MREIAIPIPDSALANFCLQWKIRELALFGSVLSNAFGPASDVDVMVTFLPEAEWSLLDHIRMEQELSALLGRQVDLVSKKAIERSENWLRRRAILESAEVVYAA